jgi:hypothetical protein
VTKLESSAARNTAAAAISCGRPSGANRCFGPRGLPIRFQAPVAKYRSLCLHGSRGECVDPDVLAGVISTVGGAARAADAAELRGDKDDRAAATPDHVRQHRAAQQEGADQVHREDPLPVGKSGLEDRAAGIVRSGALTKISSRPNA